MVRHNNVVPNGHFKKHWQDRVRTTFDQPARKLRRRKARSIKAVKIFPRPAAGPLRPIVHCPTLKYNSKIREGHGFTLEELKAAGIPKKMARTIGIAVDHRRKNRSLESLQTNVNRLNTYKTKLIVFPRRSKYPKAGDSSAQEMSSATQISGRVMPFKAEAPVVAMVENTKELKAVQAYRKLRIERTNKRLLGARAKKAEAEKEEKK